MDRPPAVPHSHPVRICLRSRMAIQTSSTPVARACSPIASTSAMATGAGYTSASATAARCATPTSASRSAPGRPRFRRAAATPASPASAAYTTNSTSTSRGPGVRPQDDVATVNASGCSAINARNRPAAPALANSPSPPYAAWATSACGMAKTEAPRPMRRMLSTDPADLTAIHGLASCAPARAGHPQ